MSRKERNAYAQVPPEAFADPVLSLENAEREFWATKPIRPGPFRLVEGQTRDVSN
jgi:hypothetical protein